MSAPFCATFDDVYEVLETLDEDFYSSTKRCIHKTKGKCYSVKIIDLEKISSSTIPNLQDIKREAMICHSLKHPHIVELLETYSSEDELYLVSEHIEGADILTEVAERTNSGFIYSEVVASHYMKQILAAVNFCHERDVIHCNIGPHSVKLATKDTSAPVKLCSFECAIIEGDQVFQHRKEKERAHYKAPELLRGSKFSKATDVWSCGVLLYTMLCGNLPFRGYGSKLDELICRTNYQINGPVWDAIGGAAKDFISKMLVNDPLDRHTASQLLTHCWIRQKEAKLNNHLHLTVDELNRFNERCKLIDRIFSIVHSEKWQKCCSMDKYKDEIASNAAINFAMDYLENAEFPGYSYSLPTRVFELYHRINRQKLLPVELPPDENLSLIVQEIIEWIEDHSLDMTPEMEELHTILSKPHLKFLLRTHDAVAKEMYSLNQSKCTPCDLTNSSANVASAGEWNSKYTVSSINGYEDSNSSNRVQMFTTAFDQTTRVRIVKFQKKSEEPMGITLKIDEDGRCIVARIIPGSMVHRQGTMQVGDEIIEINGVNVSNHNVERLQQILTDAFGNVTFKIVPTFRRTPFSMGQSEAFLKCMFDYDPNEDTLIPCTQAGVSFKIGDIIQVINKDDSNWWQVRKVSADGQSGLVPSPQLQEWRNTQQALEKAKQYSSHQDSINCSIFRKKRKDKEKLLIQRALADDIDMSCYEEVMIVPAFKRNTLVLLGAHGVGRRHIKNSLIEGNPDRYAYPIPHTTRLRRHGEEEGHHYFFVEQDVMLRDIATNQYLEYGTHDGAMYGTKLDTIRRIISTGKIAILDVEPQALKMLRCAEFCPLVVFIASPPLGLIDDEDGSLERLNRESKQLADTFGRWFDLTITNSDIQGTIAKLRDYVENLHLEEQWVPVSWVYR